MSLVENILACPPDEREAFARGACPEPALFDEVWRYVEREQRLGGFLLDPLYKPGFPEQPFEAGQMLEGRFLVVGEVARGGMGIVYEAFDQKLDRRIAIKCARAGFGRSLPPEVRHASEISHPNVCKIYEIHTANTARGEIDFLTMEFLEGETLGARLARGAGGSRGSHGDWAAVGGRLKCGACGRAGAWRSEEQQRDSHHRRTAGEPRAVITDFGLARRPGASDALARSSQVGGAPDYMAPELLKGGKPTAASDVYALGVMLHELMAGCRPFPAETPRERRLKMVPGPAHSPWDAVITRCLDPDPARRMADASQVLEAITPKRGRRWLMAAAAALALMAGGSVWSYRQATAPQETVRLAVLPLEAAAGLEAEAKSLAQALGARVGTLKGDAHTAYQAVSRQADATHVLSVRLYRKGDSVALEALLRDVATGAKVERWEASYRPAELRYAPVALAGFATASLHLPLAAVAAVNPGARQDYEDALATLPKRSQVERSLELLERAVMLDPDSALVRAALAEAQWQKFARTREQTWRDQAAESARQAELRNPDLVPVHLIAGLLLARSAKYDEAAVRFQRAIELEPGNGEAYRRLGGAYASQGQMERAGAALERGMRRRPRQLPDLVGSRLSAATGRRERAGRGLSEEGG